MVIVALDDSQIKRLQTKGGQPGKILLFAEPPKREMRGIQLTVVGEVGWVTVPWLSWRL